MKQIEDIEFKQLFPDVTGPILFAHRGCSRLAPENTLEAFKRALEHKISGIEFDLYLTKDKVPVITHDADTQRVSGVYRKVSNTKYSELLKLNVAHYFKGTDKPHRIATLEELFELAGDQFYYDIEIKEKKHKKLVLKLILKFVKKYNLHHKVMVSSFDPMIIRKAVQMGFQRTSVIYSDKKQLSRYLRNGFGRKISHCNIVKPSIEKVPKALQFKPKPLVMSWTIDDPKVATQLIKAGVCGICSNAPEELINKIEKL